jgi:hypothetical protein
MLPIIGLIAACSHHPATSRTTPASASPPVAAAVPAASPSPRREDAFDYKVRGDFFDGLGGNTVALDRAFKLCEDALARDPNNAEALVWHGATVLARSALAFRSGDRGNGRTLYQQGLAEMDRAVAMAPDNVGVRIPRGAVVLVLSDFVPEPEKSRLVARGASDYEVGLAGQAAIFSQLTLHAREMMLYGLTDAYATLGDTRKAAAFYQRMTSEAAGSELLPRAKARAAGETVAGQAPCGECHARTPAGRAH